MTRFLLDRAGPPGRFGFFSFSYDRSRLTGDGGFLIAGLGVGFPDALDLGREDPRDVLA